MKRVRTVLGVTFYPLQSAMHGAMEFHTRWGYVCFKLPNRPWGKWTPGYLYISPDATPNAATFRIGGWGFL